MLALQEKKNNDSVTNYKDIKAIPTK